MDSCWVVAQRGMVVAVAVAPAELDASDNLAENARRVRVRAESLDWYERTEASTRAWLEFASVAHLFARLLVEPP